MRRTRFVVWALLLGSLLLAGCGGGSNVRPDGGAAVEDQSVSTGAEAQQGEQGGADTTTGASGSEAQAGGAQMGGEFGGQALDDPNSPLAQRVFYFPYDSAMVSTEDREVLAKHAAFLAQRPEVSVVIEGHTDERGTREYNLALGERRAKAVAQLLMLQGARKEQLQVISFGEERPAAMGHDESAWHLNRRVELLYSGY